MSKQVLALLAKEITKDVDAQTWQGASKPFRQYNVEVEKRHYVLSFTEEEIYRELYTELRLLDSGKKTAGNRASQVPEPIIREAARVYYETLMASFTAKEKADAKAEGSGRYVAVVATYGTLSRTRMKAADDKAKALINKYLSAPEQLGGKILAPDHRDPVAEIRIANALQKASIAVARKEAIMSGEKPDAVPYERISQIALNTLRDLGSVEFGSEAPINVAVRDRAIDTYTEISSKFTKNFTTKEFDFTLGFDVSPRSSEGNRIAGEKEVKVFRAALADAAKKIAGKANWAAQESSDSFIEATLKNLANAAVKAGGSGKTQKIDATPAKARDTLKRVVKQRVKQSKPRVRVTRGKKIVVNRSQTSLTSIVNYLNSRLGDAVKRNMGPDSLVNRSGRFADSVRILSATRTAQGFPSLAYTYMRSPYDVFDPSLGARPWNIPSRNPNEIIKRSVREVAQDLAIGRFYLRRV